MDEAKIKHTKNGLVPENGGWFVTNAKDSLWFKSDAFGTGCGFEGTKEAHFSELGINIHVLQPGQPNGRYHSESVQEDFLVLSGECLLLIEGQEKALTQWDFVHCPAGSEHIFIGAGDKPCTILMVGTRRKDIDIFYPASDLAAKHGASVEASTHSARRAYAGTGRWRAASYEYGLD